MIGVEQAHIRVLFLLTAVGVLYLLRKPLAYPEKPGSKGFALVVVSMSAWLGTSGLSFFIPRLTETLVLYNLHLFSITACFIGWFLIAVEYTTGRLPSRATVAALGLFAVVHFVLLWTNFFGIHQWFYDPASPLIDGALDPQRGAGFWVWTVLVYGLLAVSIGFFALEWMRSDGLRRRQSGILSLTHGPGIVLNVLWHTGFVDLTFDPTPIGVVIAALIVSWALYRAAFLDVVPVGRRTVVEVMADAVVLLDGESRVIDCNQAALDLFDSDADAPPVGTLAATFFDPVPGDIVAELTDDWYGERQVSFEIDGRERHFSVQVSPIDADHAETLGRVIVLRDISALKRQERRLLEQNEYLDEFARVVSHDIQGPLMKIRGTADMVQRTGSVSDLDRVLESTDRIEDLAADLLRLARHGQRVDEPAPVSIEAVSRAAWDSIPTDGARLTVDTDRTVVADADRLEQLFGNLFRNSVEHGTVSGPGDSGVDDARDASGGDDARDATDEADGVAFEYTSSRSGADDGDESDGDEIEVVVGSLDDGFYVEDDGRGISEPDQRRVFDRGFTRSDDGTGLGLEIVTHIVTAHGWTIDLTDGSAGGARFEIQGVSEPTSATAAFGDDASDRSRASRSTSHRD